MENTPEKRADSSVSTEVQSWGAADDMDQRDLLISKLFQQQDNSEFAKARKAEPGDWCDSVTGEIVCKNGQPLQLIIFAAYKNLQTFVLEGIKWKWINTVPLTEENANFEYREVIDGKEHKNRIVYVYLCMLVNRLDEIPLALSLTSTKVKQARKLNTLFAKMKAKGMPSAAFVMEIMNTNEQDGPNKWFGISVSAGRKATDQEIKVAKEWYLKSKKVNIRVADEDEDGEESSGSGGSAPTPAAPRAEGDPGFDDDNVPF